MTAPETSEPVIRCKALYKVFGAEPAELEVDGAGAVDPRLFARDGVVAAVNNVSLSVRRGEILVVMGLSGSGKSTLVRCLSRLIEPSSGTVEIEGRDLLAMSERELIELRRSKMGMVFQHFALLPHRTVLENVAFPLQMRGMKRAEYVARARKMIELVGLDGKDNNFPRELSGGQQQRVGIARSLAIEPDIWFLDEPFSALDPLIRKEMQDEFLRLQSMLGKTIVFITHDFDEALKLADRIAVMFNGRVEQVGAPGDIVLRPATDYVRKFTSDVPREKVLNAGAIMDPPDGGELAERSVRAGERIDAVAEYVLGERRPVAVVDDGGKTVGVLHRDHVIKILFPRAENSGETP
ncbi:MAG: betaine/proline/choline family ABC transporter ATP-binding protein [Gammaproteobacteria bacterium]|nr:betaine/proline/choline family ABC transporter ATP-binding protein [Gammaproteobacteria bacterium]MDA8014392.1 betaine/proline/choline family ABC transporter ATP-binding protein [Gammaproteobacteria bacterium]